MYDESCAPVAQEFAGYAARPAERQTREHALAVALQLHGACDAATVLATADRIVEWLDGKKAN